MPPLSRFALTETRVSGVRRISDLNGFNVSCYLHFEGADEHIDICGTNMPLWCSRLIWPQALHISNPKRRLASCPNSPCCRPKYLIKQWMKEITHVCLSLMSLKWRLFFFSLAASRWLSITTCRIKHPVSASMFLVAHYTFIGVRYQ